MLINRSYRMMLAINIISAHGYSGVNNAWRIWIGAVLLAGLTFSPMVIAAVSLAATIATILTAPWAGAITERLNKWRVAITAEYVDAGAFLIGGLLLWFSADLPWWFAVGVIAVTATVRAISESFNDAAGMVIFRGVVPEQQFGRGVGYLQAASASGNSIGPAVGATLLTLSNIVFVYLVSMCASLANIVMLRRMRRISGVSLDPVTDTGSDPGADGTTARRTGGDVMESVRIVGRDRYLRNIFIQAMIVSGAMAMFVTVELFFILENLRADAWWYGVAVGLFGAGTFLGSMLASQVSDRFDAGTLIWVLLSAGGVALLALSRMTSLEFALPLNVLFGLSVGALNSALAPLFLRLTAPEVTARVSSLFSTVSRSSSLLFTAAGSGLAGTVLVGLDVRWGWIQFQRIDVLFTAAGICLLAAAAWSRYGLAGVTAEAARRRNSATEVGSDA